MSHSDPIDSTIEAMAQASQEGVDPTSRGCVNRTRPTRLVSIAQRNAHVGQSHPTRSTVAILDAPLVPGGLECVRSTSLHHPVLFLTHDFLAHAAFDSDGVLARLDDNRVIEVDMAQPQLVADAIRSWESQTGVQVVCLMTHTAQHLRVLVEAASLLHADENTNTLTDSDVDCPDGRSDIRDLHLPVVGIDPLRLLMADSVCCKAADGPILNINMLASAGDHEFVAFTGNLEGAVAHVKTHAEHAPAQILQLSVQTLRSIGHETGPCHVRIALTQEGPVVVGVALCFSDDLGQSCMNWPKGPDPFELALALAMAHAEETLAAKLSHSPGI